MGLSILHSDIADIESVRSSLSARSRNACFGEHGFGREKRETFNEHLLCARNLRQVRLLDPEIKCLFYSQEIETLASGII